MSNTLKDKNNELIATRWAKALIDLVDETEDVSREEVLNGLNNIIDTLNSSQELIDMINNPSISVEEKQIVLCKLFQDKIPHVVYNFIYALNLKKRVNIIFGIKSEYEKELNKLNNISHIKVTSAIELNDEKKENIKNKIKEKLNKEIIVEWNVDSKIIAGLIFDIDETVIDNSIQHKLDSISKQIIKS